MSKLNTRQQYVRYGTFSLADGLDLIGKYQTPPKKTYVKEELFGVPCSLGSKSLRLSTFYNKGNVSYICGLKASFFAVERGDHPNSLIISAHLNMWGLYPDGREVLFTQDHVIPTKSGGLNNLSNSETCCGPCNWAKGHKTLEQFKNERSKVS